jgi:hypothetical protein
MSDFQILLNSSESTRPNTPHDTGFNFADRELAVLNGSSGLYLDNIQIDNLCNPVNQYNKYIYFQENGSASTTFKATLTEGFYGTGSLFAVQIQTALNVAPSISNSYTCTYDSNSQKITITANAANTIKIVGGNQNANELLGVDITSGFANAYTPTATIWISGSSYVDFQLNLQSSTYTSGIIPNVAFRIPINAYYGDTAYYQNMNSFFIPIGTYASLQNISVKIYDSTGNPFVLPSSAQWSCTLRVKRLG